MCLRHASGVGLVKLDSITAPAGCTVSWFTMPNIPGGGALANGANRDYTGHLAFEDTGPAGLVHGLGDHGQRQGHVGNR